MYQKFEQYLEGIESYKETTKRKYLGGIKTISDDMIKENIINNGLDSVTSYQDFIDNYYNRILLSQSFQLKNTKGHHMYSQALENYKNFLKFTYEKSKIEIPQKEITEINEELLEKILNYEDNSSEIVGSFRFVKQRKYNQKILKDLKLVYNNTCQVCGTNMNELYKCSILECHHIEYFSLSQNNNIDNLLIVCPNCHRQIHKLDLKYDKKSETLFNNKGFRKKIAYNKHLKY